MAKSKKRASRGEDNSAFPLKSIIIGSVIGVVLFVVLLTVASAAVLSADIGKNLYQVIGLAAGALASFAGGFAAVRPVHKNGVPYGALAGIIQAIIVSIISFAANSASAGTKLFLLMGLMVLCSAAGGIAAVNLKRRRKV